MTTAADAPGALAGVRVVELATLYAAPLVGAMLGDLGADVVKVEPPAGDPMRTMGVMRDGHSLVWAYVGRNKRSVVLDPRDPADQATLHRLVDHADVVVANQPHDVLVRWRCTYEQLVERNPGLVMVEMNGYGHDGATEKNGGHQTNEIVTRHVQGKRKKGNRTGSPSRINRWTLVLGAVAGTTDRLSGGVAILLRCIDFALLTAHFRRN